MTYDLVPEGALLAHVIEREFNAYVQDKLDVHLLTIGQSIGEALQRAYIAGAASRDAEIKRLREALDAYCNAHEHGELTEAHENAREVLAAGAK